MDRGIEARMRVECPGKVRIGRTGHLGMVPEGYVGRKL